jgi:hypothetical protein
VGIILTPSLELRFETRKQGPMADLRREVSFQPTRAWIESGSDSFISFASNRSENGHMSKSSLNHACRTLVLPFSD